MAKNTKTKTPVEDLPSDEKAPDVEVKKDAPKKSGPAKVW